MPQHVLRGISDICENSRPIRGHYVGKAFFQNKSYASPRVDFPKGRILAREEPSHRRLLESINFRQRGVARRHLFGDFALKVENFVASRLMRLLRRFKTREGSIDLL